MAVTWCAETNARAPRGSSVCDAPALLACRVQPRQRCARFARTRRRVVGSRAARLRASRAHCTFAVTEAFAFSVNVAREGYRHGLRGRSVPRGHRSGSRRGPHHARRIERQGRDTLRCAGRPYGQLSRRIEPAVVRPSDRGAGEGRVLARRNREGGAHLAGRNDDACRHDRRRGAAGDQHLCASGRPARVIARVPVEEPPANTELGRERAGDQQHCGASW
jgi:hypothetical protein